VSRLVALSTAVLVLASAGCGDPRQDEPAPPDIVVGVVVDLGPSCPVEREDQPCPTIPLTGTELVATSGGREVRRDLPADGRLTLELEAGTWDITATAGMSCDTVTVSASGSVEVSCDTGIR
jgi:hypothetical protein